MSGIELLGVLAAISALTIMAYGVVGFLGMGADVDAGRGE